MWVFVVTHVPFFEKRLLYVYLHSVYMYVYVYNAVFHRAFCPCLRPSSAVDYIYEAEVRVSAHGTAG